MGSRRLEIVGWFLFLASALSFVISALRSGDGAALVGSLLFLIACFVFLWPLVRRARGDF